ncbi:adenomatous polyposis coli homolog isoform X2 [Diorhabda carinulata]|uniref:adenomatous polyposis coli homolog isoform X2 n=1 Tax=Diorhabda carinulata TaxID=1163345 RepID=UPI0025A2C8D8|nr:adenomatous polyposis coli homolog isoform X2 [Diorhabda carinulata]
MSLPVSQYEALLAEMRGLRRKAQRVQQMARPLLQAGSSPLSTYSLDGAVAAGFGEFRSSNEQFYNDGSCEPLDYTMESLLLGRHNGTSTNYDHGASSSVEGDTTCSEDEYGGATRSSTKLSVSSEPTPDTNRIGGLYHGTWPVERTMWNSEPTSLGIKGDDRNSRKNIGNQMEVNSVMSFASSSGGVPLDRVLCSPERNKWSSQQLEAKMDVVHSLLSMLGGQDHVDMGETLLALSTCPESCLAMRQSGCIPLLVQLVQSDRDGETRTKAAQALHNLVHSQPDEKLRKRESRVLKLLDHCRAYTEAIKNNLDFQLMENSSNSEDGDRHPVQTVAHLMKLSFDEGHRQAICQLGGIHTIATLVEVEHTMHGSTSNESHCILMRRYACMALTNLTFGDSGNKALLCSFKEFMRSLVVQLESSSDELRQVTASVLRNLSWRADSTSKEILREVGSVGGLMRAAMVDNKENTLKSILSALWNLSAHCTENKSEICSVNNALGFLVDLLTYKTPTKSLAIIENSGGILRNISSQIAVRDDYREILRRHNCLQILLDQLKSPSLTVVSNACGTLWNLSAKCRIDQEALWQMGAPGMLRCLNHSKHKMIAMGSSAALKNLLSAKPQQMFHQELDATALTLNLPVLPTLGARKQKALMQDLDSNLTETYENIEKESPINKEPIRKTEIQNLSNNFSSLNLNEPSTSNFPTDPRLTPRLPPSCGSSSLSYKRQNCTFIPVRNKFSDCGYDDEIDVSDQPIDYSKKYSETKVANTDNQDTSSQEKNFGMYAETDLDQPTDYSLRYAEDDSDEEITKNEDTLKTYCTEDTPYETPFNFSTATSMSDLRIDDKQVIDNDKLKERETKASKKISESPEEKERCSTEDISDLNKLSDKIPKSELSSGLMSPEKPINYAEEGTPGYFSRVSSFGSLTSIPANETIKGRKQSTANTETTTKPEEKVSPKPPTEGKAVKFERVVNYAEETPLMFSRSSSLASLDSIEQHSIHDDRSSVVSDFSRLTSGIVSPSELPDSPTQTVPPSPKPRNTSLEFPSGSKVRMEGKVGRTSLKPSVFEDNTTKFKEESTPIQFSTATSLSSLTIDDHEENCEQANGSRKEEDAIDVSEKVENEEAEKKDEEKETTPSDTNDEFVVESDVDEDMLADCISIGMQNSRHSESKSILTSTPTKLPVSSFKYTPKGTTNSGIPTPRSSQRLNVHTNQLKSSEFDNNVNVTINQVDTIRTYCTEDTPVRLSNAASNSDLSLLSTCNDKESSRKGDYLSDDSSNLSGENDNILAECIQSGMPKAKKDAKQLPSNSKSPRRNSPSAVVGTSSTKYPPVDSIIGNTRKSEAPKVRQSDLNRRDNSLSVYSNAGRDELENYAVENSPCHFSLRSSLSDLTVDGSVAALKRNVTNNNTECPSNKSEAPHSSHNQTINKTDQNINVKQESRRESLSSISVESLGSLEAEQALLEQCISSGMPKSNPGSRSKPLDIPITRLTSPPLAASTSPDPNPKNVSAASVAGNTNCSYNEPPPENRSNAVADVEKNQNEIEENDRRREAREKIEIPIRNNLTDTSPDKCSPSEETLSPDGTRSGSRDSLHKILDVIEDRLIRSCEDSKVVDNRMLDPDAMIESLDRFTAELMSQASHLNNYKVSTGDNTWNEEISPNDVTFPSISGSAPNVITFSNEEEDLKEEVVDPTNDFTSLDTSTMTDSTLIAIEAGKIATVFKNEADMSISAASLELDHVQPPSQMNSLTNSAVGLPKSPKLPRRKKSLPIGLMVRRALNNSLNNGSSLESLSNLDHVNPPSDLLDDMEGSTTSVASLPIDNKIDFIIDGPINDRRTIFDSRQPFSELEHINPPSLFNEITDFCNSLADVPTEGIGSETEIFEDCFSQVVDRTDDTIAEDIPDGVSESIMETALDNDDDDTTIFSDAKSSMESTPKKIKSLSKSMTTKQRRNQARDRYKTYTIAAEMVMREEIDKQNEVSEDFKTADFDSGVADADSTTSSYLESSIGKEKLTPKERRRMDRSRFETQILDRAITDVLQQPVITSTSPQTSNSNSCSSSPAQSPARTKLSIRRSFMQKRLENKERFRTRTISESSFSPEVSSASPPLNGETEVQMHLQKEANRVLKTLRDTKTQDELLDCETLSLVSNDDDSEYNSGGSANYRTYHKSWGLKKNVPVIANDKEIRQSNSSPFVEEYCSDKEKSDEGEQKGKPKIVKPDDKDSTEDNVIEEQPKSIRGRRKPLYSKTGTGTTPRSIKPVKTVTSNLVKNVTSTLKFGASLKTVVDKPNKKGVIQSRTSSGYGSVSPKTSPSRTPTSSKSSPKHVTSKTNPNSSKGTPPLDRQGTFTKDEQSPNSTVSSTQNKSTSRIPMVSKIPSFTSKIASKIATPSPVSKIPGKPPVNTPRNGFVKSASSDRANRNPKIYNRSTSADSREPVVRKIQSSPSTQSLKGDGRSQQNVTLKKSSIPSLTQRSSSNNNLNSSGSSGSAKKQVTSKIASLWKKIEDSKKKVQKPDTRVWIHAENEPEPPRLIRSNTFDNKDSVGLKPHNENNIARLDDNVTTDSF